VPHADVRRFFATAAAQVLPSIWCENSPVACYESFVFGLPLVGSRIGGIPSLCVEGETGLLAAPRDPDDLARRLVELLTDAELRAGLERGCRAALARYLPDAHAARIEAVYEELLEAGARECDAEADAEERDTLAVLDALLRQLGDVERWALSMQAHIRHLEGAAAGHGAARTAGALGKHLVRILERRLR
jgi:hypothetical protein